jgi:hypothetical protein
VTGGVHSGQGGNGHGSAGDRHRCATEGVEATISEDRCQREEMHADDDTEPHTGLYADSPIAPRFAAPTAAVANSAPTMIP